MKLRLFYLIAIQFMLSLVVYGQKPKSIDKLFSEWNQKNHPGGVVLVTKGEKIVYNTAFGKADIENGTSMSTSSCFNLASVSKQFTAFGIVLLHLDQKLTFDDTIDKYIPELSNWGSMVTIRQLLHHTSGIRSTPELFELAGWPENKIITTDDDLSYLTKQVDLNYFPSTKFDYSNSNYVLLATIISRITKQEYATWMKENVFEPLEMNNTFVNHENVSTFKNSTCAYVEFEQSKFDLAFNKCRDIGASNIYATAQDVNKWLKHFYASDQKWNKAFELLKTITPLKDNQKKINYAFGVICDQYHGKERIYHSGGVPGYLSYSACFPEEKLNIIVLSNYLDYKFDKRVESLISLLIPENNYNQIPAKMKIIPLDTSLVSLIQSSYWNYEKNYSRKISFSNDTVWYERSNGLRSPLYQVDHNKFIIGGIKATVYVRFEITENQSFMYVKDGNNPEIVLTQFNPISANDINLEKYCGNYFSSELGTTYSFKIAEDQLVGYHPTYGTFDIEIISNNLVHWIGAATSEYLFDRDGNPIAILVTMGRLKNIRFNIQR